MNSAFNHHAGKQAGRIARCAALACALAVGGGSAIAQQHGDRRDDPALQGQPAQPQRTERFRLPPQGGDARQADPRGYEDGRRMQQEQPDPQRGGGNRNGSRMTPDERRDLRRQINEAGMDLYPQRRHDR
jgi:hypothetical protein